MIKKNITSVDLDGNPISKDYYFNLSKAEIVEWNFEKPGGLEAYLKRVQEAEDQAEVVQIIKTIILKSVGVKADDGIRFIKSEQIAEDFRNTDAYSELFMELATDADAFTKFVKAIVPKDLPTPTDKKAPAKK